MAKKRYAYTVTEDDLRRTRRFAPFLYFFCLCITLYPMLNLFFFKRDTTTSLLVTLIASLVFAFLLGKLTVYLQNKRYKEID